MKVGHAHTTKQEIKRDQEAQTRGESKQHKQETCAPSNHEKHHLKAPARGLNTKCEPETQLRVTSQIHKQEARARSMNQAENPGILHPQATAGGTCGDCLSVFLTILLSVSVCLCLYLSVSVGLCLSLSFPGFPSDAWDSMDFAGFPWDAWNFMGFLGYPWFSLGCL